MPVTVNKPLVRFFVFIGFCIFHAVLFFKAFNLSVTEHWEPRHSNHECTYSKIFVAFSKLCYGCFLIRIVHEVYVALKNLRIKGDCVFYSVTVFLVFFFFKHVHECTVVNAVHTKSAYKVTFHHPESFGKKKSVWNFLGNTVYNFAPEFIGNCVVELFCRKSCFTSGCNVSSVARLRIP